MKKPFEKRGSSLPCGAIAASGDEPSSVGKELVGRSFQTWLQDVTPVAATRAPRRSSLKMAQLITTQEMIDVSVATVRESTTHRHWPKDVVEKFLAAELIDASYVARIEVNRPKGLASLVSSLLGWRPKTIPAPLALRREVRSRAT